MLIFKSNSFYKGTSKIFSASNLITQMIPATAVNEILKGFDHSLAG